MCAFVGFFFLRSNVLLGPYPWASSAFSGVTLDSAKKTFAKTLLMER